MMKKNKLYTINKRRAEIINRPAFMPDKNLFGLGDQIQTKDFSRYSQPVQFNGFTQKQQEAINKGIKLPSLGGGVGNLIGNIGTGVITSVGNTVGNVLGNVISGGKTSGVGNFVGSTGRAVLSEIGTAIGGPIGGVLGDIAGSTIGAGINALFGQSVDEEALKQANEGTAAYNNYRGGAKDLNHVQAIVVQPNVRDVYEDGLFGGDADEKNEALRQQRRDARSWAFRSQGNDISNILQDQKNNAMRNLVAFGGLTRPKKHRFDDGGYMTEQEAAKVVDNSWEANTLFNDAIPWTMKQDTIFGKEGFNAMYGNLLNGNSPALYSLGGDLQTHGGDYKLGRVYEVTEEEANHLKAMGYEFTVVS